MSQVALLILYCFLIVMMLGGVIGALIPALPGASLVVIAIIIWAAVQGFQGVGIALGVGVAVLIVSTLIDILAGHFGAQKAGASRWGIIGSFVGLALGFFGLLPALPFGGPLLGMLVGPLLGAFLGELLFRSDVEFSERLQVSAKAALGILVGTVVGNILQALLAFATVIVFIVTTWPPIAF
ncbi:MAG: DUF456 family protein [Cyanobacteria bacterium P01_H01_bin.121]